MAPKQMQFMVAALVVGSLAAQSPADGLFLSRDTSLMRLRDVTGDGDFLDSGEVVAYASNFASTTSGAVIGADRMHVLLGGLRSIVEIRDVNGDGDALDTGEVRTFAILTDHSSQSLIGLVGGPDGSLYTIGGVTNLLYRIRDLNEDGDALDIGEVEAIASGLSLARQLAFRSDGRFLSIHNSTPIPVRILRDRNTDGDFLDFAENLSYVENVSPGDSILTVDSRTSYWARSSDSRVLKLRDVTGDDDALDAGEIVVFAENLASAKLIAADGDEGMYVALANVAGDLYRIRDGNGDGDALDPGETLLVATGLTNPTGLAIQGAPSSGCRKGDLDQDGHVGLTDAGDLGRVLIGEMAAPNACTADCNSDGTIDGADVAGFIEAFLSP